MLALGAAAVVLRGALREERSPGCSAAPQTAAAPPAARSRRRRSGRCRRCRATGAAPAHRAPAHPPRAASRRPPARPPPRTPADTRGLDQEVQGLKKDVVDLNRDLFVLEEELLFPANTQVAVFLSMDVGDFFALDSVSSRSTRRKSSTISIRRARSKRC